jgi:hypothetical protein
VRGGIPLGVHMRRGRGCGLGLKGVEDVRGYGGVPVFIQRQRGGRMWKKQETQAAFYAAAVYLRLHLSGDVDELLSGARGNEECVFKRIGHRVTGGRSPSANPNPTGGSASPAVVDRQYNHRADPGSGQWRKV